MSVNNVYNFNGYSWPENIILIAGDSMIDRINEKRISTKFSWSKSTIETLDKGVKQMKS